MSVVTEVGFRAPAWLTIADVLATLGLWASLPLVTWSDWGTFAMAACRVCGCTDDRGCDEGCTWVEPDLCSSCAGAPKCPVCGLPEPCWGCSEETGCCAPHGDLE